MAIAPLEIKYTHTSLSDHNLSIQASRNRHRQTAQIDKTRYNQYNSTRTYRTRTETSKPQPCLSHDMISMHIRHHDSPHPSICRAQDPKAGQGSIVNQPRSFWRQARGARRSTHGLVRLAAFLYCTVSTRCWAIRSTGNRTDRDGLEIGMLLDRTLRRMPGASRLRFELVM